MLRLENKIEALPTNLQFKIMGNLDTKSLARFKQTCVGGLQLASADYECDYEVFYINIFIPKGHPEIQYDTSQLLEMLKQEPDLRFYVSYSSAEEGVNSHSWYKKNRGYFIVSCRVNRSALAQSLTSERKESSALNARDVLFFRLNKNPFTIDPHYFKVETNVYNTIVEEDEKPLPESIPECNRALLEAIKIAVFQASSKYQSWYDRKSCCIMFSIFNHHGSIGQQRARDLYQRILKCTTSQSALQLLKEHLDRREGCVKNHGRLGDHSLDTFLLNEIAKSGDIAEACGFSSWKRLCNTKDDRVKLRNTIVGSI